MMGLMMKTREQQERARLRALLRERLDFFCIKVLGQLFPEDLASANIPYLEAMCRAMQDVLEGITPRLLITIPPRHLKSTCAAAALPAFVLGHHPNWEIFVISYGEDLLRVHSDQFRQVIMSDWYRALFPKVRVRKGQNRADEIVTTKGGRRKASSVQGSITGRGAHLVIMDDMMKADDIHSDTNRERAKTIYRETIRSRQNDQRNPREIVLQQRLGVDDFAGSLIDAGTFRHFNLPLVAEEKQSFPLYNDRLYTRRPGDILNPDRWSQEDIEDLRRTSGEQVYQAQYQQNPDIVGNGAVRFEEIATREHPLDKNLCAPLVQSWDPAFTTNPGSDYSVCTTWGLYQNQWHLLDLMRDKLDFPDLKRRIVAMRTQWNADKVVIELDGSGRNLVRQLMDEGHRSWVIGTSVGVKNKENRLIEQSERLISGDYVFPRQASWFYNLRREFMAFPSGNHDDQVDSISQFVCWINERRGKAFMDTDPRTGKRNRARRGRPIR